MSNRLRVMSDPKPEKQFFAEFTKDMTDTLDTYFESYSDEEGVLTIEVNEYGLWLVTRLGGRQFLGKARNDGTPPVGVQLPQIN